MHPEDLIYWRRGFNYDRSHIFPNKVVVETYRILIDYCEVHRHCRAGAYLMVNSSSRFYPLGQMLSNFDLFSNIATGQKKISENEVPDLLEDIFPLLNEQLLKVFQLKHPIYLEFESQNFLSKMFGYKFHKPISLRIEPSEISYLRGTSLGNFEIGLTNYCVDIHFRDQINIKSTSNEL